LTEDIAKAKPNLNVLTEYRKREAEFLDRAKDMEAVTTARDRAKKRYEDLRKTRLEEFMTGFSAISSKLKEMYQVSITKVVWPGLLVFTRRHPCGCR
jgi:structural maintenance of chromosome 4